MGLRTKSQRCQSHYPEEGLTSLPVGLMEHQKEGDKAGDRQQLPWGPPVGRAWLEPVSEDLSVATTDPESLRTHQSLL